MKLCYVIKLKPITKKNHSQIVYNPRTKRPFVIPSKQYIEYEKQAIKLLEHTIPTIDYPVNVECRFFMPTKRKCDLTNLLEAIDDILVKAGVIADDNYTIIQSHDGSRVHCDKECPRTEIFITEANDDIRGTK